MGSQQPAELAAAILAARGPYAQLLISEAGCDFDAVRAAYKRLLFLHPDKNPGCGACAEAFKVVTSAFNELQAQHERRRSDVAQPAAAAPSSEQGHSRWGAFTSRPAWAARALTQPDMAQRAAGVAAAASAAAPAVATSKPVANRWGRPTADYGKLFKPGSAAQPAQPIEQSQDPAKAQENSQLTASSPDSSEGSKLRQSLPPGAGVAPSAFYAAHAQQQSQPAQPSSLYSLFAAQPQSQATSNRAGAAPLAARQVSPNPLSPQHTLAAGHPPDRGGGGAASRWGSKPAALINLLRQSAPQPGSMATAAAAGPVGIAGPARQQAKPARGFDKQRRQQQTQLVLESLDSEDVAVPSEDDRDCASDAEPSSRSSSDDSDGLSDPEDSHRPAFHQRADKLEQCGDDSTAAELQAAVQRHEAGALLAARGAGAAAVQAGRKRALQRHYSRRGKGRQKKGATGMQAKLQLVAVGSKRVKSK